MTREETVNLIRSIISLYPNWKPENLTDTVNAWHWALEEYPAPAVKAALQIYLKTNNTGFAPSVSQLIGAMYEAKRVEALSEGEAWSLVKRAIQDGGYHAQERFNELPPIVQRAVGSPNMIHQWSQTDTDTVNTVIMSNFQRTYKAVLEKQEFGEKVPAALSDLVKNITDNMIEGGNNDRLKAISKRPDRQED